MQRESNTATQPVLDDATRSFVRRSLAAGLVEVDDVKKVVVSLMSDDQCFTPQRLAEGLEAAGILTRWQANKLLAGKSKGFYLGSYRLLRPLGKGGMGVVYVGEHHVMKRLMALKILPPEATRDPRRIERFKAEARACAQLDHPNIVRAYDFSEAGSKLYIVMEYVDGIDLHHAVARDGVMSVDDALDALVQATRGLAHAHERGIIHRDIKPSNLLLRTDGVVKVSDLGLARIGVSGIGEPGQRRLMGTADFVAPEQAIDSKSVDARADIYSLGCSFFFLLTGKSPFEGTVAQRLAKHQTAPVPDLRSFRKDCSAGLAELTMRMMSKRPEDRPKSAAELLSQLRRFTESRNGLPRHPLRNVAPAGDTVVDAEVYRATIEDSSLSADEEVAIEVVSESFDFDSLPPIDLGNPDVVVAKPVSATTGKSAQRSKSKPMVDAGSGSGNQQVLLGVGLAFAVLALLAVVGVGAVQLSRPLPEVAPKIKATEDGQGRHLVIIRQ